MGSTRQRLPVRAVRGWIEGKRYDKAGRVVKARLHPVTGLAGGISGKEMEREMQNVADAHGLSYNDIRIETYAEGEAPRQSNPNPGDKIERYTLTVKPEGWDDKYDRAFGPKKNPGEGEDQKWSEARPGVARLVSRGEDS